MAQVITDYTATMPPIVRGQADSRIYIQLCKRSLKGGGTLPECVFACLRQEGYLFSTDIAAHRGRRLFFFLQNYQLGSHAVDKQRSLARSYSSGADGTVKQTCNRGLVLKHCVSHDSGS